MATSDGTIAAAKLDLKMSNNLDILIKKHQEKDRKFGNNAILINCFDGARHSNNTLHDLSIVCFSCILFSTMFGAGSSTACSKDIQTWQQIAAPEAMETLMPAVEEHYPELCFIREHGDYAIQEEQCKIWPYQVHDYSMLYKLIGHTSWNGNFHPYPLCKCNKKEGCTKEHHKCELLTPQEHRDCYEKSLHHWNTNAKIKNTKNKKKRSSYSISGQRNIIMVSRILVSIPITFH